MFPGGCFQGSTYRVTKTEADDFWRHSFGNRFVGNHNEMYSINTASNPCSHPVHNVF